MKEADVSEEAATGATARVTEVLEAAEEKEAAAAVVLRAHLPAAKRKYISVRSWATAATAAKKNNLI